MPVSREKIALLHLHYQHPLLSKIRLEVKSSLVAHNPVFVWQRRRRQLCPSIDKRSDMRVRGGLDYRAFFQSEA
ncbi:hypothetical protein THIOM_002067 [Candidatus Thiomargarita nelsonii]|uniref:Uncharacterized protein n=1 Tax=Candidatus Thiomargarita nelsonii TaxID=1003181 RepID=A0A176S2H2_9GAMM|nr:hypothetical protein THIOM_002067 [Candidatus Thiomargarita nelsonii]